MQSNINQLQQDIKAGSFKALARAITIVENSLPGYEALLLQLEANKSTKVVGITGPPGAGKSTLVNALLQQWLQEGKRIAVVAVDPSSPFNYGALLGDRIRMNAYYTNPNIYIRSLASRGALGGLSSKIIEITDIIKESIFDIIVVETVGVGQSEIEVAGLADCTVLALVPEAGDEVQTLKAGIMEIANLFVVNKADRADAEALYRSLKMLAHERAHGQYETEIIKTIATQQVGIEALSVAITNYLKQAEGLQDRRLQLLTEKCRHLIQTHQMRFLNTNELKLAIQEAVQADHFNLYAFTKAYIHQHLHI